MLSTKKILHPKVSFDAAHFYLDNCSGPHWICERSSSEKTDITRIVLPFHAGATFSWEKELLIAEKTNKKIIWEIDFPSIAPTVHSQNARQEQEKLLAVKHFTTKIYPQFLEKSIGIVLHKGRLDFGKNIEEIEETTENFLDRIACFCREIPDPLTVFLCFDVRGIPPYKAIQCLHQKRFGHFAVALLGANFPFAGFSWGKGQGSYGCFLLEQTLGLLVPDHCFEDILSELEETNYRILYKEFANQDWFDLEAILFDENTPVVRRILQGFQAAGGKLVSKKGNFGWENEYSLKEYLKYRGRGI